MRRWAAALLVFCALGAGTRGPAGATEPPATPPGAEPNAGPSLRASSSWPYISPNGDGRRDRVRILVTVDRDVVLTVRLAKVGGSGTRVLADETPVAAGTSTFTWNGRLRHPNGHVSKASDGVVSVQVTVADDDGTTQRWLRVVVDTRPPKVRLLAVRPEPWSGWGALTERYQVSDSAGPATVWARAMQHGRVVAESKRRKRPAAGSLAWYPRTGNRVLAPGGYHAEVVARDAAGNTGRSALRPFRVHRPVTNTVITRAPRGNRVAITIDDCVDGTVWRSMLDTLRRLRAGATFFCNGDNVQRYPGVARRASTQPRISIGSHTTGHPHLTALGYGSVLDALLRDQAIWWNVARTTPVPFFRPPYGSHDSTVRAAAGALGFPYTVLWDVDTNDWQSPGASVVTQRAVGNARRGSIILLHVKPGTAEALPAIIKGLRARGLEPSGLAEMLTP